MKNYLIAITALILLSCQEDLLNEVEPTSFNSSFTEESLQNSVEIKRPKVRFRKLKNGATRMVLIDQDADTTGFLNLSIQCCESISFTFQKIEHKYRTRVDMDASFEGQIVTLGIEYLDIKGNVTLKDEFRLFVFEDGKTAMHNPEISENSISGSVMGSDLILSVQGAGDPAGQVEEVIFDVLFKTKDGKEIKQQYSSVEKQLYTSNPGYAFLMTKRFAKPDDLVKEETVEATVSATFKDVDGNTIGDSQTQALQFADFTGRIKRIRIKKRRVGTGYNIVVVQDGGGPGVVATAEVRFEEPFEGPSPSENLLNLDPNPSSDPEASIKFINKELEFEGNPIGLTYPVSASLIGFDGKPIGETFNAEVLVEGYLGDYEITYVESNVYLFTTTFNNENKWIDNVSLQFEEPFEGPAPLETEILLESIGIDEDGMETLQGKIQFEKLPDGQTYQMRTRYRGPKTKIARRFKDPIFGPSRG